MQNLAKKHKSQAGFTLVELLLVISLIGITVGVTADIIFSLVRSYSKTQVTTEIEQEANFLLLKLEKELKNATSVSIPNPDTLEFTRLEGVNEVTITYQLDSGVITRTDSSGTLPLTDSTKVLVTCPSQCFESITTFPDTVGISMSFSQATSGGGTPFFEGSVDLNSAVVVRGTY